jgi:hypothetical protein
VWASVILAAGAWRALVIVTLPVRPDRKRARAQTASPGTPTGCTRDFAPLMAEEQEPGNQSNDEGLLARDTQR